MPMDAVAVLAIAGFEAPDGAARARHRGDASLLALGAPFTPDDPAMMRFALRMLIGDALDAHGDPRGVLFLPAALDAAGVDYAGIVAACADAGAWAPGPEEAAPPPPPRAGPDAALLAELAATLGAERADGLAIPLEVALINEQARPDAPSLAAAAETAIAAAMGAGFAARLTDALRVRLATELAHGTAPPPILLD